MTPPPMLRVRCLGWTRKETSKEAKLHGRQCPLHASLRVTSFRGLSLDASQTWFRLLLFAFPRGKSSARHRGSFTRLSAERAHYSKTAAPESSAATRLCDHPAEGRRQPETAAEAGCNCQNCQNRKPLEVPQFLRHENRGAPENKG